MAVIVLIQSKDKKHRVKVTNKPFVDGRSSKCHLKIDDDLISGQHIAIQLNEDTTVIKDLNSTNGTFINGSKIDQTTLLIGEEVQIGSTKITLDVDSLNVFEKKNHRNTRAKTNIQFVPLPKEDTSSKNKVTASSFDKPPTPIKKLKEKKTTSRITSKQEDSAIIKEVETPSRDSEHSTDHSSNTVTYQDYEQDASLPPKKKYEKNKGVDFVPSSSEVNFDQETQGNTHMLELKNVKKKKKKVINDEVEDLRPESIIARLISKIKNLF